MTVFCKLEPRPGDVLLWCSNPDCEQPGYAPPINQETGNPYPPEMIHRPCGSKVVSPADIRKCGSCAERKETMNALVPGSGDLAEKVISVATLGNGDRVAAKLSAWLAYLSPWESVG